MCGIAGIWAGAGTSTADGTRDALARMLRRIRHRGPDDEGMWLDPDAGVALGHRRLSILDLSPQGHQPMVSASGRYVIVFNGEVYNHARLRPELERAGCKFRGHSDTEVMLAGIEQWGLDAALKQFNGMFAFALWDRQQRSLVLARDRLGIKPLYYGWAAGRFAFASELKAIAALPGFANPVDRNALSAYLRFNYVPAPWSIYQGLRKLLPGTYLRLDASSVRGPLDDQALAARTTVYWSSREVAEQGVADPLALSDAEATGELESLLRDAVGLQMEADVPLGAFLSGGVDSSAVVALMQAQSTRPVQTFSIGFSEADYSEAAYAKAVAQHLGTNHTEMFVTPQQAMDVIQHLPSIYGEPIGDSSQIPTYLVSQLARQHVTVSLSGDGGDELFAGYNRHFWVRRLWRRFQRIPQPMRSAVSALIRTGSPAFWDRTYGYARPLLPSHLRVVQAGHKLHRLADVLRDRSPDDTYHHLVSQWDNPDRVVIGAHEPATELDAMPHLDDLTARMLWMDLATYLPDDILAKVDRASMAVSLEARVPLLDHRLVEFAWRVPMAQKIRDGQGKWLLRQVLYKYVPKALIERPKAGFGVPLEHWLRGPLRDWAESLLSETRLRDDGFFDPAPIQQAWREHLSGRRDHQHQLWSVLMFQSWLDEHPH